MVPDGRQIQPGCSAGWSYRTPRSHHLLFHQGGFVSIRGRQGFLHHLAAAVCLVSLLSMLNVRFTVCSSCSMLVVVRVDGFLQHHVRWSSSRLYLQTQVFELWVEETPSGFACN